MENASDLGLFRKKIWNATLIIALVVALLWFFMATFSVLLLVLAGVLIALYFRGLAGIIHRKTKLPEKYAVPVATIGSLLLLGLFFWLAGNRIEEQVKQLSQTLPETIELAGSRLGESQIGQQIMERASSKGNMEKVSATVKKFFSSTFGVLGDVYVVIFLGLFFTVGPKSYLKGFYALFPVRMQPRAEEVTGAVGNTLSKWLKGKIFSMLIVAVLTAIGLYVIGIPMALTLAIIAGILNFIPNFGPLIAMIPAVLIAFTEGPVKALIVAALYILIQILESNIITPQIQKRLIEIPPALIIIAQLLMGVLTGGWGLLLATAVVAIVIVLVKELWIKSPGHQA